MNAIEREKADELAKRRIEDMQARVVEAIGEMLSRMASRKTLPSDNLADLAARFDLTELGPIAAMFAEGEDGMERIREAFSRAVFDRNFETVADLAKEVARHLYRDGETP
jgi:hypothetical protein